MPPIKLSIPELTAFGNEVSVSLRSGGSAKSGPIADAFAQWGEIYRAFSKQRFSDFSRGGGDWAPLSPATLAARLYRKRRRANAKRLAAFRERQKTLRMRGRVRNKRGNRKTWKQIDREQAARFKKMRQRSRARTQKALATISASILYDTGTLIAGLNPTLDTGKGATQQRIENGIRVGYGGPARYPDGKATIADIASFHQAGGRNLPRRRVIVEPDAATIAKMVRVMQSGLLKQWEIIKAGKSAG